MWIKISLICGLLTLCLFAFKAYSVGKKEEQLDRLKREVKGRAKANEIMSNVVNLNRDELNHRMYDKRKTKYRRLRTKNRLGR